MATCKGGPGTVLLQAVPNAVLNAVVCSIVCSTCSSCSVAVVQYLPPFPWLHVYHFVHNRINTATFFRFLKFLRKVFLLLCLTYFLLYFLIFASTTKQAKSISFPTKPTFGCNFLTKSLETWKSHFSTDFAAGNLHCKFRISTILVSNQSFGFYLSDIL